MTGLALAMAAGLAGGLVASGVMNLYQSATAGLFGQDQSGGVPANEQAAQDATKAAKQPPLKKATRKSAGMAVHYATGAILGILYAGLVRAWPEAAIGFGVVFGIVVSLVLDDLVVPLFGWGDWPWKTELSTHAYGLSAHMVFGAALEGVRRLAIGLLV